MKTVITDHSLCTFTLDEAAKPEHIYEYIRALADAGIRYVELDFRTIMRVGELPNGIGYIFRMVDPMFARLVEVFDFNYITVTLSNLQSSFKTDVPVILEFPALVKLLPPLLRFTAGRLKGTPAMIRLRGSYPLMSYMELAELLTQLRSSVALPLDFCPMNEKKTALDTALKLYAMGADSVSMTLGITDKYASIEDFLFSLLSVYDTPPKDFDMGAICRAAVYHRLIFRGGENSIQKVMKQLDTDIMGLRNADTGERVKLRVALQNRQLMCRQFESALDKLANESDIPDDVMYDISEAIRRYDASLFNEELLYDIKTGLLN